MRDHSQQFHNMIDHGFTKLIAAGYGAVAEAFHVTAQTREKVLVISRKFHRADGKIEWLGDAAAPREIPQDKFQGRQKMWGDLSPENLT